MTAEPIPSSLEALRDAWAARWEEALALFSRHTRLLSPRFCLSPEEAQRQRLEGSFAMIRLTDHAVVVALHEVARRGLGGFALEVMGHEIGHHVFCPGDVTDHGRLVARTRAALPGKERLAPFVANLYADALVNDRLQRVAGLDMAGVFRTLGGGSTDRAWTLYMRAYEHLWRMPRGTLATGPIDERLESDASLAARVVRAYAKRWLDGAGRFAALLFPYLEHDDGAALRSVLDAWLDTLEAGAGGDPSGLTEIDDAERYGAIHPALDPELSGVPADHGPPQRDPRPDIGGGRKNLGRYREVGPYGELLRAIGVRASDDEIAIRYYRERAAPYLVRFPTRKSPSSSEPLPEGLETWEPGSPLERADWLESVLRSPAIVPGVTTVQRTWGEARGGEPRREAVDLYVGIDCSGSMPNPRVKLSYPVLAGTILVRSALRAGARVKVVLSGEPGKTVSTDDFVRDEREALRVLTSYLGTGYGFGVHRLGETFGPGRGERERKRAIHVVIFTDQDVFSLLDARGEGGLGWDVAHRALENARGGGTMVLHMPEGWKDDGVARLESEGWTVHRLYDWKELVEFAEAFSRRAYEGGAHSKEKVSFVAASEDMRIG